RPDDTGRPPEFTNSLGMHFKLIPAGKYTMGSSKEEIEHWLNLVQQEGQQLFLRSESPEHEVAITRPFYLGVTEVTVGQFRRYVDANPKHAVNERWQNPGFGQNDDHPVVFIDWQTAVNFCNWLSEKEGR